MPTVEPTITSTPTPVATSTPLPAACPTPDCVIHFGVSGQKDIMDLALEAGLPFSHYLNWRILEDPPPLEDVEFWQMVRVSQEGQVQDWEAIGRAVDAQPGSIWVVGNEPDIIWQDNVTPDRYAHIYHDVYTFIKERDPTAKVAIGGVGQPTPLRLAYLDIVLETYETTYGEPMPIDVWTVHNFILREEADSWGVGIPPGMEGETGELYELEDHDDLAIFQQNLINFRAWMAERGYADRPLAITEFGILHPWDFGFPEEVVVDFMIGAFDILMNTVNETGYPADDGRLVQWWFWFSVYDALDFPTGNLYDPDTDRLTPIGEVFASYVRGE